MDLIIYSIITSGLHRLTAGGADQPCQRAAERFLRMGGERVLRGSGPGKCRKWSFSWEKKTWKIHGNPMEFSFSWEKTPRKSDLFHGKTGSMIHETWDYQCGSV